MADTNELGGFIQSLRAWPERPEIVGLVRLPAWPGGTATHETFLWLRDEMVAAVAPGAAARWRAARPARRAGRRRRPDVEGEILDAVRRRHRPRRAARRHARPARQRHRAHGPSRRRPGAVPHGAAHRRLRDGPARRRRAAPHPHRRRPARDRLPEGAAGRARGARQHAGPGQRQLRLPRTAASAGEARRDPRRRPGDRAAVARHSRPGIGRAGRHGRRRYPGPRRNARGCHRISGSGGAITCRNWCPLEEARAPGPRAPRRPGRPQRQRRRDHVRSARRQHLAAARVAEVRLAAAGAGDAGGSGGGRGGTTARRGRATSTARSAACATVASRRRSPSADRSWGCSRRAS